MPRVHVVAGRSSRGAAVGRTDGRFGPAVRFLDQERHLGELGDLTYVPDETRTEWN